MSILLDEIVTANSSGVASFVAGRVGFDALITLVHIRPIGSVNAASKGAITLTKTGRIVTSNIDISNAATLAALGAGTQFTVSEDERLTIGISGASDGNKFLVSVHTLPIFM